MIIGFTSSTLKDKSVDQVIELAEKSGSQWIEWSDKHVTCIETARKIAQKCSIPCSLGSYYRVGDGDTERWEELCKIARALGAKLIRVWLGRVGSEETRVETYARLVADGKSMAKTAGEFGIKIGAEAHQNTFNDCLEKCECFLLDVPEFYTYYQSRYIDFGKDLERLEATFHKTCAVHVSFSETRVNQRTMPLFAKRQKHCVQWIVLRLLRKNVDVPVLLEFCRGGSTRNFLADIKKLHKLAGGYTPIGLRRKMANYYHAAPQSPDIP